MDIKAKKIVNRQGGKDLIQCLNDPSEDVRLNVVQTIANCAEDHPGRSFFLVNGLKFVSSEIFTLIHTHIYIYMYV